MTARSAPAGAALRFDSGINPPSPEQWPAYLARHGRSFSFASALIPEPHRSQLVAVYAYCRFTDDLVDVGRGSRAEAFARLDWWLDASEAAYHGYPTEHALVRVVMRDMAESHVPFDYIRELMAGMRMDLLGRRYDNVGELRTYCYRVASVVGLWLTELFGVREKATLERAASLGIAMQLTNIIRDVGEDWRRGRLYLPRDIMRQHGLMTTTIDRVQKTRQRIPLAFAAVLQDLMKLAETEYAIAWQGLSALPEFFRPAVGVASRVYAAIHDEVRAHGYDTLRQRAATSPAAKLTIAAGALRELGISAAALELLRTRA